MVHCVLRKHCMTLSALLFSILYFIHQVSINFYKLSNKTKLVIEMIKHIKQHLIWPAVCQMQA